MTGVIEPEIAAIEIVAAPRGGSLISSGGGGLFIMDILSWRFFFSLLPPWNIIMSPGFLARDQR